MMRKSDPRDTKRFEHLLLFGLKKKRTKKKRRKENRNSILIPPPVSAVPIVKATKVTPTSTFETDGWWDSVHEQHHFNNSTSTSLLSEIGDKTALLILLLIIFLLVKGNHAFDTIILSPILVKLELFMVKTWSKANLMLLCSSCLSLVTSVLAYTFELRAIERFTGSVLLTFYILKLI